MNGAEDCRADLQAALNPLRRRLRLLLLDRLLRTAQPLLQRRQLRRVLLPQCRHVLVALLARLLHQPRAEVALRLAPVRRHSQRWAPIRRQGLRRREPGDERLLPVAVVLRLRRRARKIVEHRAGRQIGGELSGIEARLLCLIPVHRNRLVRDRRDEHHRLGGVDAALRVREADVRRAGHHRRIRGAGLGGGEVLRNAWREYRCDRCDRCAGSTGAERCTGALVQVRRVRDAGAPACTGRTCST